MTSKSQWVETEVERAGEVYLLPIRCQLWARKDRLRTVIQTRSPAGEWAEAHRTPWVESRRAGRLTRDQLDEAAEKVADTLTDDLATGPLHAAWVE